MKPLPYGRTIAAACAIVLCGSVVPLLICVSDNGRGFASNPIITICLMLVLTLVPLGFLVRWWIGVVERAGYDTGFPLSNRTGLAIAGLFAGVLASVALTMCAYAITHSYDIEAAAGIGVGCILTVAIIRFGAFVRTDSGGQPNPIPIPRVQVLLFPVLAMLSVFSLVTRLQEKTPPGNAWSHAFFVGAVSVGIALMPVGAYRTWKQYRAQQRACT